MDPALEAAVDEETRRSGRYMLVIRVFAFTLLFFVHTTIRIVTGHWLVGDAWPILIMYPVVAGSVWLLMRKRPRLLRWSWYLVIFLDIPTYTYGGYLSAKGPPYLLVNMVSAETGLVLLVMAVQLSFRRRELIAANIVGASLFSIALWRLGVGVEGVPWVVTCFPAALFIALYVPGRILALTERALGEQRQRIRELDVVNQELRRQITDRAGQLADAIARLSIAPALLGVGSVIEDRYRVIRELGKGGMGAVYEIERIQDQKQLALKVLSGVADREALVRFAREAQIAAKLDHPNVVSVLDVDVSKSGMLFLVMELVAGNSLLAQKTNWGNREWARPILKQIADALSAMHAQGIVHRDLKPANVLLDGKSVKVADFGIACLRPQTDGDSTITKGMTQTGAFMGTPIYMAPELVKGARDAQPSADVWSFGVLAHELLTGKLPFAEPPVIAKLEGRAVRLAIGDSLAQRCMSEDPRQRPTASELGTLI
jgi:predicted Ser/Thr protein kinase